MLFNTIDYAIFFIVVVAINYILPHKYRYVWLLVASYYFYGIWNAKYTLLMLAVTVITYIGGISIERCNASDGTIEQSYTSRRKAILSICCVLSFGLLVYFKYTNFLIQNINSVTYRLFSGKIFSPLDIILPVGISFYTFQAVGYVIDVYRGEIKAETNFLRYALFVSFFPQLVAGPIERSKNLLGQLRNPNKLDEGMLREGLILIGIGVWQKILIADNIAKLINPVFDGNKPYSGLTNIVAVILFGFQIYCDFGGYTNIAIGSAKILGVNLMNNFASPYFATSVTDFWARWHISLTSWFRDYLYVPLGGNRKGKVRKYINTFIVFAVSGLWHGAAWNYIVWGIMNGVMMIASNVKRDRKIAKKTKPKEYINYSGKVDKLFKTIGTFVLVDFAWLFFRASSCKSALMMIKNTVQNLGIRTLAAYDIVPTIIAEELGDTKKLVVVIIGIAMLMMTDAVRDKTGDFIAYLSSQKAVYRWLFYLTIVVMTITFGTYGREYEQVGFIYFQF